MGITNGHQQSKSVGDRRKPGRIPGAHRLRVPHVAVWLHAHGEPHGGLSPQSGVLGVQAADGAYGAVRPDALHGGAEGEYQDFT